jgi:hypothetical protein
LPGYKSAESAIHGRSKRESRFQRSYFHPNKPWGVAQAEHTPLAFRGRAELNKHCQTNGFLLNLEGGMQTVIQVIATGTGSLRNKIMSDPQLEKKFGFIKVWHKQPGRPHGWAKIHSARDIHGAINLEWHARSRTLICRVVTKLGNKPNSIIGDFVDYLLARHQSRILAIHIMRR